MRQDREISFPNSSAGKEAACNAGDPGSIPGLGSSSGEGIGYLVQYSWSSSVAQLVQNLPREFHGLYSPWHLKESDMTERLLIVYCCLEALPVT